MRQIDCRAVISGEPTIVVIADELYERCRPTFEHAQKMQWDTEYPGPVPPLQISSSSLPLVLVVECGYLLLGLHRLVSLYV